jgi:hypothetical protein
MTLCNGFGQPKAIKTDYLVRNGALAFEMRAHVYRCAMSLWSFDSTFRYYLNEQRSLQIRSLENLMVLKVRHLLWGLDKPYED